MNILVLAIAALVPLIIGFIWYNQKVFGQAWMTESGMTEEKAKTSNMALTFGLTYLFSFFLAWGLQLIAIHQIHIGAMLYKEPGFNDPNSEVGMMFKNFMDMYGNNFRTFKHGFISGILAGIAFGLPILGVNALFEMKSFKYIAINVGFWVVSMALMGGIICAWM